MGPVTRWWAVTDRASREWSSSQVKTSVSVPSASGQWVKSDCQHSLGWAASNRRQDDLGRLARVGGDQPGPGQVAADGGGRDLDLVVVGQVPADGVRPGVQALPGQFLAQPHDQVRSLRADCRRRGLRPPGPRLERGLAFSPVPGHQPGHPALRHPVGPGYLALAPALGDDSGDDKTRLRHPPTVPPRVFLCPETRHSHVLKLDTIAGATQTSVISPLTCDSAGSEGIFVAQEAPARSKIPTKSPQPARGGGARQAKPSRTAPGRMLARPQAAGRRVTGGLLNISSSAPGRATPCTVAG